jgi:hypothetical protein
MTSATLNTLRVDAPGWMNSISSGDFATLPQWQNLKFLADGPTSTEMKEAAN